MNHDRFKELLEELDGNSLATLAEKNARYSSNGDALHNFRSGADIMGGTPAEACWGYLTKHLTALRDMVQRDDFSNREDFLEKCQDTINYIRFLWCIGNEYEVTEVEPYLRAYFVYRKSDNTLVDRFIGEQYSVKVFDGGFAVTGDGDLPHIYYSLEYYCEEHTKCGDHITVKNIEK